MKNKILRGISAAILAACVALSVDGGIRLNKVWTERQNSTPQVRINQLSKTAYPIGNAVYSLQHEKDPILGPFGIYMGESIRYPNPGYAKKQLTKALGSLDSEVESQRGILENVRESLPNEDGIQEYKGLTVDTSTFEPQRKDLGEVTQKILDLTKGYMSQTDKEFDSRLTPARAETCLPIALGSLALFGLFPGSGSKRKR